MQRTACSVTAATSYQHRRYSRVVISLTMVLVFVFGWATAQAHELRPAVADLNVDGAQLSVEMRLNLEALIARIGPEHQDSEDSPNARAYNLLRALTPAALETELQSFLPSFFENLTLQTDTGNTLALQFKAVRIPDEQNIDVARDSLLSLEAALPADSVSLTWQWVTDNGPIIVRAGDADSAEAFAQYLEPGQTSDPIMLSGDAGRSVSRSIADYLRIGFVHIIPKGLDHILFVVGLFLLAPRFKPILWQVSSFTLAHTITLALGILGIVTLPASIVEPLIALSIVVVGVENMFTSRLHAWRPLIVFVFGLLHGLGFAGVLGDIGLDTGSFLIALISFNVGVELGQLAVILLCFIAVGWLFREKVWYRQRIALPGSALISAVGMFWFLQRISAV